MATDDSRTIQTALCARCSRPFDRTRPTRKYCSKRCGKAAYQVAHLEDARVANRRSYQLHKQTTKAAYRQKNSAKMKAARRDYYLANREHILAVDRKRKLAIREQRIEYMRQYNARPDVKARLREYRKTHAVELLAKNVQWRERNRARAREFDSRNTHRRRALARNAQWEPVDRLIVFARDRWTCQLCRRKTPRSRMGTRAKDSPTLDHIVPLSIGGSHCYQNVQCACLSCNCSKNNRTMGQLRLL